MLCKKFFTEKDLHLDHELTTKGGYGRLWFGTLYKNNATKTVVFKFPKSGYQEAVAQLNNEHRLLCLLASSNNKRNDKNSGEQHVVGLMGFGIGCKLPRAPALSRLNVGVNVLALEPFLGDLETMLLKKKMNNNNNNFEMPSLRARIDFCLQLAEGLKYLADFNIIHRDLKLANLLYKQNHEDDNDSHTKDRWRRQYRIAICDLGAAIRIPSKEVKSICAPMLGNLAATPPEIIFQTKRVVPPPRRSNVNLNESNEETQTQSPIFYSLHNDVYSFGVCVWEIITLCDVEKENWGTYGVHPFDHFEDALLKGGRPDLKKFPKELLELKQLVSQCFSFEERVEKVCEQVQRPNWCEIIATLKNILEVHSDIL